LVQLCAANIVSATKDWVCFVPGPLSGGNSSDGARKCKENAKGFICVVLDFDKGDAPLERLGARLEELGLTSVMYATFSHLKEISELTWGVQLPNAKTGKVENTATRFQDFVRARLGLKTDSATDASLITGEIVKAFMVEEQGIDAAALGEVTIDNYKVEGA